MTWISAAWLAGAAAIVIPILLHLRDRHPPDVVRVGSVADLVTGAAMQRRQRLDDIPLLLLRCAIIVLAAVLMAGPQLEDTAGGRGVRVAVLTPGDDVTDSLRSSGTPVAALPASPHPWSLAAWADTTIGAHDTIILGSANATMHAGTRPVLAHAVVTIGATPRGMAPTHRAPRTEQNGDPPARHRDRRAVVWWLLVAAIVAERVADSRVRR